METMLPKGNTTTHRQMRNYSHELLRRNVIDAASRLLVQEGPDALTVRRVAQELECSTKIIYTMFHGKDGLANALYLEGCARLQHAVSSIPVHTEPGKYLSAAAWVYWQFALDNPSYYLLMFCGAIPNFTPDTTSILTMETAFEMLVKVLQQYMEQGVFPSRDPVMVGKTLWAAAHGVVSLQLLGHFHALQDAEAVFIHTAQAIIFSFLSPQAQDMADLTSL